MVISDITNPFFPQLARGAEDAAIKHGYLVVASNTDDQLEREKRILSVLRSRRVDGILLVVAPNGGDTEHIRKVIASKIPLVCLDRVPKGLSVSAVTTDAVTGSEMCMRHLLSVGHRRIAIITGDLELQTACDRLQGYKNALAEANIPVESELIMVGDFRFNTGYLLAKQLLLSGRKPTAAFVSNGMMALGALRAIKELGLQCPGDIALAVFDEVPGNGSFWPDVTSVVQPAYQIGYQGVELLLRNRESGEPVAPTQIRLQAELRIGESTLPRRTHPAPSSPGHR
jgi:LacI family transcriptional regulator